MIPSNDATPDPHRSDRLRMVQEQIEKRGVTDPLVLEAMRRVPRHLFVPPYLRDRAYDDVPLPIGSGQTISQPFIVAYMSEAARVRPGDRVLEIGAGSGYQAAVLATVGARVFSMEILPEVATATRDALLSAGIGGVELRTGDGWHGWPEEAPFDAILVTAAPEETPEPLTAQLVIGGRLILPVGAGSQELLRVTRTATGIARESLLPVRFVPMTGEARARSRGTDGTH
jgi:protein-L-isoaspartate(D-aspartate) O-methyltransferase